MVAITSFLAGLERAAVMAIINVTPDSFSGDGLLSHRDPSAWDETALVDLVRAKLRAGADIIDIGAESTRPGAAAVDAKTEQARLAPWAQVVKKYFPSLPLSIDSSKPQVVEQLLPYGIDIINDVAFGRDRKRDQMMTALARHMGGGLMGYVVMHNVANSDQLEKNSLLGASYRPGRYQDLLADIDSFFGSAIDDVTAAGVARDRIVLDAGFGFGKSLVHSLQLVAQFNTFAHWQLPLLFGISRKSFIGKLLGRGIDQRLHGGMMLEATAMNHGAGIIRVHDVAPAFDLSLMAAALHQQRRPDYIIALGSNMGGREQHMQQAIDELQQLGQVVAQSSFYETAPQYNKEQDYFINGAVLLRADHEPLDLLARLKDIEQRLGRITEVARFQPRPIDLDIIAYGEQQLNLPDLTIPHAAATERAFVLAPLVDLKPFFIFRDIGCYARDLLPPLQRMQGIKKISFQANLL